MSDSYMGGGFAGPSSNWGQGGPGPNLWDALSQLRGMFEQKAGPRMGRGDVRAAVLALLAEKPMHGYQIISEIAERSGGVWKPSPGSIYPTLQQLEDEGLVTADAEVGRRTFRLTDEGRTYVAEHQDEVSAPWEAMSAPSGDDENGFKPLFGQVATAMWQILASGTPEQQARAREAVADLRRKLYGILAEDDDGNEQDRS